ncbi:splicing factor, arginine/serine-rich 15-like isoform X1 [Solea senegalensis]|uniref:Splicing factor, arginine/serine-rich 15-like isoform X1 n=1 Tax=Solea senegalensis TaxID=28829 RepID=A0AAV6PB86_SOLSE|nr:SR-related and CTD-associated factor 4-like [Solea senegalensis]KAG7455593.1 splicing factor, arginine/serine-rich 15-like isoform X1 [Solea senegalensis]
MDAVNAFNMELFSMIDLKPPISRAKMMSVTKSAIKAIKLYKHVVQIVEKFIKKCKPELKVPGLYVVDSIVRQSRHQFGVDKDVFGPRFLKNFTDTFQNLYHCPEDDKNKIIRVLNLWQKNGVFDMDIIQPLMDMANDAVLPPPALEVPANPQPQMQAPITSASAVPQLSTPDALAAVAQLFQSPHGQELQRMLQNFQQADKTLAATETNNTTPPQMPVAQLNPYSAQTEKKSSFAEKLLDRFDYDDEPEDITPKEPSIQAQFTPEKTFVQFPGQMPNTENVYPHMMGQTDGIEHGGRISPGEHRLIPDGYHSREEAYSQSQANSREHSRHEGRNRGHYGRRTRSRSASRSPRRRRSRSSSRSRRSRHRRSRSRSREQRWGSRSRSQDRIEREKDRERRQKGLPSIKGHTLNVCSTTLWVGQLDKKTQQSDVMCLFEEFGQIESINMIPPRGCAYIVMVHRQDAYTALKKLSRGSYKVHQKPVKVAWALNKGIKSALKKFWDVEQGVTCIPWSKVKVDELEIYREGGMLDTETLNPEWNVAKDINRQTAVNGALESVPADGMVTAHIQVPPVVQQVTPIGSPPAFPGPVVLSPTAMPAGGAPFIPTEFDTTKMPQVATSVQSPEDSITESKIDKGPPSDGGKDNQLGSPVAPVLNMRGPAAVMQGPRPGMPPLQPPPNMPNPHLPPPPFLSAPNMPHMPPQMLPGGPMFAPERFRMPISFSPRGPPFHRLPSIRPEVMGERDGRLFPNGRPAFGPPFLRGRW